MIDLIMKPKEALETLAAYQELYKELYVKNEYAAYVIIFAIFILVIYALVMLTIKTHYSALNEKRQYEISGYELQERKKKAEQAEKKPQKKKKPKRRNRRRRKT